MEFLPVSNPSPAVPRESAIESEVRARSESWHFTDSLFLQKIKRKPPTQARYKGEVALEHAWAHTLVSWCGKGSINPEGGYNTALLPLPILEGLQLTSSAKGENSAILKLLREPQGLYRRANLGITASEDSSPSCLSAQNAKAVRKSQKNWLEVVTEKK